MLADRREARQISFRLRYHVFCHETGFENPASFPDQYERDIFDGASTIFLLWDHLTCSWAGTMRLVSAKKTALPSETLCWPTPLLELEENRSESIELSRLCILPEFRRIHAATHLDDPQSELTAGHRLFSVVRQEDDEILLRLILGFIAWAQDNGVQQCYFLINAALARVLNRLHVPLVIAGPEVEHRGVRRPYKTHIATALREMREHPAQVSRMLEGTKPYLLYSDLPRMKLQRSATAVA